MSHNQASNSTSFLDVLACALGGMAMLFLILSIMPHQGTTAKQTDNTLDVSIMPATPKPTQGREVNEKPALYQIEHPDCELTYTRQDDDFIWSQSDGKVNGRRIGYFRIIKSGKNTTVDLKDCKGEGDIIVRKIMDFKNPLNDPFKKPVNGISKIHYTSSRWR